MTRLIPNGITHHFILDPPIDHDRMRVLTVDVRLGEGQMLDRRSDVVLQGPTIHHTGHVTRSHTRRVLMLAALPDDLHDAIREAVK